MAKGEQSKVPGIIGTGTARDPYRWKSDEPSTKTVSGEARESPDVVKSTIPTVAQGKKPSEMGVREHAEYRERLKQQTEYELAEKYGADWREKQAERIEKTGLALPQKEARTKEITPREATARAAQISRENPSLSNEEALATAMAEQSYTLKVPAGGGREATDIARQLATLYRYEREEKTPEKVIARVEKERKEFEAKNVIWQKGYVDEQGVYYPNAIVYVPKEWAELQRTLGTEKSIKPPEKTFVALTEMAIPQPIILTPEDIYTSLSWLGQTGTDLVTKIDKLPPTVGMNKLPVLEEIGRGALRGVVDLAIGTVTLPMVGLATIIHLGQGQPVEAGKLIAETGIGIKDYFVSLGKEIIANPAGGIPRTVVVLAPTLVEGVKVGVKSAKGIRTAVDPYGIPKRAMAVEMDVSRIPWEKAGYEESLTIVGKALEKQLKTPVTEARLVEKVIVKLPDKTLELNYRCSPIQAKVPDTVYHATPNVTAMLQELKAKGSITLKGQLYTSPQVAMDFLRRSATGVKPENPAIVAIRISDLEGFKTPFKQYKGAIEAEVVGEGIKLYPTETNFYSRAFGKGLTGETFTQYLGQSQTFKVAGKNVSIRNGQLVPTYWLRTAGTKAGVPSIGSMYAATGMALVEAIKDLPYMRPKRIKLGFYGSGDISPFRSIRTVYSDIKIIAEKLETKAVEHVNKIAKKSWSKEQFAEAVRKELDRLTTKEVKKILNKPEIKEAIRRNRDIFENNYTVGLAKYYGIASLGYRGETENKPSITETPPSITTIYKYRDGRLTKVGETREPTIPTTRITEIPPTRRESPRPPEYPPTITTTRRPPEYSPETSPRVSPRPPRTSPRYPPRYPPPEEPPAIPPPSITQAEGETRRSYEGAVAWQQGALKRKGKLTPVWKVWSRPYRQEDLETFFENEVPPGVKTVKGVQSAYATIQQFRGKIAPRETQVADIGAFVATVHQPTATPGGKGEIKFTRDTGKGWKKLPLHTTLEQLIEVAIKSKVPSTSVLEAMGMTSQEVTKASLTAKEKFAKARLVDKMGSTSQSEIVRTINKMELTPSETKELLRMLPDREQQQVKLQLSMQSELAPTRGYPKAEYLPVKLRRRKSKGKRKIATEPVLARVRL